MCVVTKKHIEVPFYFMSLYGIAAGIVSLISYSSIESRHQGYNLIIDNWDQQPISDIRISRDIACDSESEENLFSFNLTYYSNCAVNQTLVTDAQRNQSHVFLLDHWKIQNETSNFYFCGKRIKFYNFINMMYLVQNYKEDCAAKEMKACYHEPHIDDQQNTYYCIPTESECPIYDVKLVSILNLINDSYIQYKQITETDMFQIDRTSNIGNGKLISDFQISNNDRKVCLDKILNFTRDQNNCENEEKCSYFQPDYDEIGLSNNEQEILEDNQKANSLKLKIPYFQPSKIMKYKIYAVKFFFIKSSCLKNEYKDFFMKADWLKSLQMVQLMGCIFGFVLGIFVVVIQRCCIQTRHQDRRYDMRSCLLINIFSITFSMGHIIGPGVILNKLNSFFGLLEFMDKGGCVEPETLSEFKQIGYNLENAKIYNIVLITTYSLIMGVYFLIMIFKNQIHQLEGIDNFGIEENHQNIYRKQNVLTKQVTIQDDPDFVQNKVLSNCIICLDNSTPLSYLECCGHPMHQKCNSDTMQNCPMCRSFGKPVLVDQILNVYRAFSHEQSQIKSDSNLKIEDLSEVEEQIDQNKPRSRRQSQLSPHITQIKQISNDQPIQKRPHAIPRQKEFTETIETRNQENIISEDL